MTCGTYHSPNILICKMMSVTKVLGTVLGTIMETIQQVFASFAFSRERALEAWVVGHGLFAFNCERTKLPWLGLITKRKESD